MSWIRRVIIFLLGTLLLYDAIHNNFHAFEFIIGLIMVGLLPIDLIVDLIATPSQDEIDIERLHKIMTDVPHTPEGEEEANDKDHPDTTPEETPEDEPS